MISGSEKCCVVVTHTIQTVNVSRIQDIKDQRKLPGIKCLGQCCVHSTSSLPLSLPVLIFIIIAVRSNRREAVKGKAKCAVEILSRHKNLRLEDKDTHGNQ